MQDIPTKNTADGEFDWDKGVFHQPWPQLDTNYNLKLVIRVREETLTEIPVALWK